MTPLDENLHPIHKLCNYNSLRKLQGYSRIHPSNDTKRGVFEILLNLYYISCSSRSEDGWLDGCIEELRKRYEDADMDTYNSLGEECLKVPVTL